LTPGRVRPRNGVGPATPNGSDMSETASATERLLLEVPALDIERVNRQLLGGDAVRIVEWAAETFGGGLVLSTSFGIQAAVMLHVATRVVPDIPVVWVDTGYLPPETYRFAEELIERLRLDVRVYQSPLSPARMEALHGRLWLGDVESMNRYDRMRKVEPMMRALDELRATAWISGLRADQTEHRESLPIVGTQWGRYKVLPILGWSARDVQRYLEAHGLPYHPLFDKGYVTVGDWHSSRPLGAGDIHGRDTRFRGLKQECGLHLPETVGESQSRDSSDL